MTELNTTNYKKLRQQINRFSQMQFIIPIRYIATHNERLSIYHYKARRRYYIGKYSLWQLLTCVRLLNVLMIEQLRQQNDLEKALETVKQMSSDQMLSALHKTAGQSDNLAVKQEFDRKAVLNDCHYGNMTTEELIEIMKEIL